MRPKGIKSYKNLTVRVDPDMVARLDSLGSGEIGEARTYLLRRAIKQFVETSERQKAQQAEAPRDRQQEVDA